MAKDITHNGNAHAIYAEFAKANIKMKNGLNRRVFNTVEVQHGDHIHLEIDGSIKLLPGAYRITGFSLVTMQATMVPPVPQNNTNYPGYCLLYKREDETNDPLTNNIGIGSPATALDTTPSLFDTVLLCDKITHICVGHQSGEDLHDEVYIAVENVDGIKSLYHVFARIAITML